MTIGDLIEKDGVKITCDDRWLEFYEYDGFVVQEQKKYAHRPKILIATENEDKAVDVLLRGAEL